jgi:hypothetical protein
VPPLPPPIGWVFPLLRMQLRCPFGRCAVSSRSSAASIAVPCRDLIVVTAELPLALRSSPSRRGGGGGGAGGGRRRTLRGGRVPLGLPAGHARHPHGATHQAHTTAAASAGYVLRARAAASPHARCAARARDETRVARAVCASPALSPLPARAPAPARWEEEPPLLLLDAFIQLTEVCARTSASDGLSLSTTVTH